MGDKVKFYGPNDLRSGSELKKAESILHLNLIDSYNDKSDINDIIELYNISLYIEAEIYLRDWDKEFIKQLPGKLKEINQIVEIYFNSISEENIYDYSKNVNINYIDDLLSLITHYKIHKRLGSNTIDLFLDLPNYDLASY